VEAVLGLYGEKYFDLNVSHFHEKLKKEHQIDLSYTWVKAALQGENLALRHQIGILQRSARKRPKLTP